MGNSNALTGGIVGVIIVISIIAVFVVLPTGADHNDRMPAAGPMTNGLGKISEQITTPTYMQGQQDEHGSPRMSLVEIFERTEPGVVRINVQRSSAIEVNDGGVGSGFVYDKRGHIITNSHVIQASESINVTFLDGRSYEASVVGVDKFTDIAIIKVDAEPSTLHPLKFGDSSELKVGQQIAAIGNPFGLSGSMTSGIVSQVGRLLPSASGYSIPDVIQTDAAINPGNSGGPLLNMRGEVIGVNNAIQSTTGEFAGVGFAIPSQTMVKIAPILISDGSYAHPWVGISGRDIGPETARLMGLDDTIGFLVVDIMENSPAYGSGLHTSNETVTIHGEEVKIGGDVIRGVDGQEVRKIDDILVHLQRSKAVGDTLTLEVHREGQIVEIPIILQQRPD